MGKKYFRRRTETKNERISKNITLGKIIVQYLPEAEDYLNELSYLLFQKEYFGFLENSFAYIDNLVDFIDQNLAIFPFRNTPEHLVELGSKYIFYEANKNTTWYIFFENAGQKYIVTFISNNHSEIAQFL